MMNRYGWASVAVDTAVLLGGLLTGHILLAVLVVLLARQFFAWIYGRP